LDASDREDEFWPIFAFATLGAVALGWTVWAGVTRGGVVLRLTGLAVVRADGRPAPRLLCAWRAVLFWLPIVTLLGASIWLDATYWAHWDAWAPRGSGRWMLWSSWLLWSAGMVLPPVYLGLALWRPDRAPHDRLAGPWRVPR
jgi:hypothetical protein